MVKDWAYFILKAVEKYPAPAWQSNVGQDKDVVVSTRLRIARNLPDYKFPHAATERERLEIADILIPVVESAIIGRSERLSMSSLSKEDRMFLVGQRLISPLLAESKPHSSVIFDKRRMLSIMINEEDHLRLQVLLSGCDMESAMQSGLLLTKRMEGKLSFAKQRNTGYLTASPINAGHGMRLSVLLHLVGLFSCGILKECLNAVMDTGIIVRGLYGEGTTATGGYYQISSNAHKETSPEDYIMRLKGAVNYLIERERQAREKFSSEALQVQLESVFEAINKKTTVSIEESLIFLSWIRWASMEKCIQVAVSDIDLWSALMQTESEPRVQMGQSRLRFLRKALSASNQLA